MLQIKGINGRDWATVGELADRLQVQQHATVALVSRCETLGLVERRQSEVARWRTGSISKSAARKTTSGAAACHRLSKAHTRARSSGN